MRTIFYFNASDGYYYLDENEYKFINNINNIYDIENAKKYHAFNGYEANEPGLRMYKKDFNNWCKELKKNCILDIDYNKYYNHHVACSTTFKRLSPVYRNTVFENIDKIESQYMDNCFNGGLQFFNEKYKDIEADCYGYDFSKFYPYNLTKIQIPTKKGRNTYFKKLPEKLLDFGFYKVKISCENKNIRKIFAFSTNDTYTHYDLEFIRKHQKQFNIKIDLITDIKTNAYIYNEKDLIKGKDIFNNWYNKLLKLSKMFPKNRLLKHIMSSLWGQLVRKNKSNISEKDMIFENYDTEDIIDHFIKGNNSYYVVLDSENLYKDNIARIKCFLTSYGRVRVAKYALQHIDNVIRIQTDGVVYNQPCERESACFIPEEKTTGTIIWNHVNKYEKIK